MRSSKEYTNYTASTTVISPEQDQFYHQVIDDLLCNPKRLSSKYFYDKRGDELFQKIMNCPEYYLTDCEMDIFSNQTHQLANRVEGTSDTPFDLIELGVGDGTKSKYLLEELLNRKSNFTYYPIDISGNVLTQLENNLAELKSLDLKSLNGDYLDMLSETCTKSSRRKVVLFLGANVGNMTPTEAHSFCQSIRKQLMPGDKVLIGFDLKKNPKIILDAYNDKEGITRDFNFNLLERINRELDGTFDIARFTHYPMYDPQTGACKSYVVSTIEQSVYIGDRLIQFNEGEWIFMEISQKYAINEITALATQSGFLVEQNFSDSRKWFVDSMWTVI